MTARFAPCLSACFCLALLAVANPAFAQSLGALETMQPPLPGQDAAEDARWSADDDMQVMHVTDRLARMPESIAALRAYQEAKAQGLLSASKVAIAYEVGSEKEFNVLTDIDTEDIMWEARTFTLVAENDIVNLWVANDQQGVATDDQLAQLETYVFSETPEGSWRPDQGIIANSNHVFGDPPVEPVADGKVDVLFFDIEEGSDECCILGFVTLADLDPEPEDGQGNMANVLYVDLPQGLRNGVLSLAGILTHEYQHLIHFAYQHLDFEGTCSTCELTFVNEGLSEWSELLHGFPPRPIRYLNDPREHGVRLLTWRRGGTQQQVLNDYQRSGLFTTYIADRIGREATGSIVRAQCPAGANFCPIRAWLNGAAAYNLVLGEHGLSVGDIVADFHAANFINDASAGATYAYKPSDRVDVKALSTQIVDTQSDPAPYETTVNVSSGAVEYITWLNATDLALEIKDFGTTGGGGGGGGGGGPIEGGPTPRPGDFQIGTVEGSSNRANLSLRVLTETEAGVKQVVDLDPDTKDHTVKGAYAHVTLIVVNTFVSEAADAAIKLDITGNWGGDAFDVTTVAYEIAKNQDEIYLSGGKEDIMAQAYPVPDGAALTTVFVAPVYCNQYRNCDDSNGDRVPNSAPRDFALKVWDVQWRSVTYEFDDSTDPPTPLRSWRLPFPGNELYSQDVDESPNESHIDFSSGTYSFRRVNLSTDDPALAALPDSIFIGLANKGEDENYLSPTLARSTHGARDTLAYWYGSLKNRDGEEIAGWRPMAALRLCRKAGGGCDPDDDEDGWFSLTGQVFPIRARFRAELVTSSEGPLELPSDVTLAQNYPNPFNPTTSISWSQPASAPVRLSVYNLLGQRVAMPVDGLRPAGEHEVRLDASGWASGVYVYVLETGAHSATRRMVLIK